MDFVFEQRANTITCSLSKNLDCLAHLHEHIEAVYMISGYSELILEDGRFPLNPGDFSFVFPNQIHSYENSDNVRAFLLIFSPELIPEFSGIFAKKLPVSPVVSNVNTEIVTLIKLLHSQCEVSHEESNEIIRGIILALTGILFKELEFTDLNKYNISTVKNILLYCNEHYSEPITIDDAAKALHISRSHLSHIFKERLNSTFGQYILKRRIEHACLLLKHGECTVTEAAIASGFDSVRTFNRVFSGIVGVTPRDFVKNDALFFKPTGSNLC